MNKLIAFFQKPYTLLWLGAIAVVVITTLEFMHDGAENYIVFRDATVNFFNGISSYTQDYVNEHGRYYIYSPVFHYLFATFAFLPFYIGGYLWNLAGWCAFFFAIKTLPGELASRTTALLGYLLLLVMQSVFCFQYNILVCCVFLFAFTLLEKDKPFWAILLIMFSATTKIYGLIELAFLLCYPKFWRNLGYALICGICWLMLPITQLGLDGLVPWYQEWFAHLSLHFDPDSPFMSLIWAQPIQSFALAHTRWLQIAVIGGLSIGFFLCKKQWQEYPFKVGVLATLMGYIVLLSESAEFSTYTIAITGFALWYFLKNEHTIVEKILFWVVFALFGVMPIDIFFPAEWCLYIHKTLWIGVWVFTLAWGYIIYDTIKPAFIKKELS